MTFKRMVSVALMTVLLVLSIGSYAETYVFPVEPATPTETGISMDDAISIAKNEMAQRQGMSLDDVQNYRIKANYAALENGEEAWVVTLFENEMYYPMDATLIISSTNARVIDYQATDMGLIIQLTQQWKNRKGDMRTWSIEDKALFKLLYGSADEYVVPGEEHISQEEARNIALAAIPQSVSSPEFSYSFDLLSYTDGRPDQYVWMVTILVKGQEKYLVHVSAVDGAVAEVFSLDGNG